MKKLLFILLVISINALAEVNREPGWADNGEIEEVPPQEHDYQEPQEDMPESQPEEVQEDPYIEDVPENSQEMASEEEIVDVGPGESK